MAKVISQFFNDLGFPFKNIRWSWGARNKDVLLLRTWDDEYKFKERKLTVLGRPERYQSLESYGLDERIVQLKAVWEGGIAAYTVIATVKDANAIPREILAFRDDAVFALDRLELNIDGSIIALVGERVPITNLNEHAKTHRTAAGEGVFPINESERSGLSTDSYKEKIPAIRTWLIEVCHRRGTVTYSEVMDRFGLTYFPLQHALSQLGQDCQSAGEPIITALIVDKTTRRCSEGLYAEFHVVEGRPGFV